jgi:hypothetical protein
MQTTSRRRWVALAACTSVIVTLAVAWSFAKPPTKHPQQVKSPLLVHEWGTFLSVQGSNGEVLGGMVDSDEVLPGFVEARGFPTWQRSLIMQKMETPVTYFYTDTPRDVAVRVEMPQGILTHWFPAVHGYGPGPSITSGPSYLDWRRVHLIPDTGQTKTKSNDTGLAPPPVKDDEIWRYARQTDAALVRIHSFRSKSKELDQVEKFLFYRGLGTFRLPLAIRTVEHPKDGLHVTLHSDDSQALRGLFLVSVEQDGIRFAALEDLAGDARREVALSSLSMSSLPLEQGVTKVKNAVAGALVAAGLYAKEAQAMVNTWERSYFRTQGLRLLYLVPRPSLDRVIPIHIRPEPDSLVRVIVGRVEILTPAREREIEHFVADLGAKDFSVRATATAGLARLGRLSEPALHRVVATTSDPEVRARAQVLIQKMAAGN